jgi:hypothetical protein
VIDYSCKILFRYNESNASLIPNGIYYITDVIQLTLPYCILSSFIYGRSDYQSMPPSQLPQNFEALDMARTITSQASIAASSELSELIYGKND